MIDDQDWAAVSIDLLQSAVPWRTFRWYKGQKHYSGTYWSATMQDHVIYESRLELSRLLLADFAPAVNRIIAQPFLLTVTVRGKARRHIPDYLLITDQGPVVVDVKPLRRLSRPEVVFTFDWTRELVEARGWTYEVSSEPPAVELENIRFLAGYRRDWLVSQELLNEIRNAEMGGVATAQAMSSLLPYPEPLVRAAIHHLLWTGYFTVDLGRPLSSSRVLRRAA
ncbi:TnsA-like heteromeric transposase endonuclease subunit [Streptomyces microflavus]|uniref:TnsA-like heteromeric transposase endonuclease subunit n=1 Tax=Streptomyces microflavus TaxID=1919 RepID=UPI0033BF726A